MTRATDRSHFLGATDIPALLGVCPKRTAYEVWLEKTGRLEENRDSPAMKTGRWLEPALLDRAEEFLGPLERQREVAIAGTPVVCHPDGLTQAGEPVEAKTSGIEGRLWGEWGEEGTDEIPEPYVIQCLVQLEATRAGVCHVPALLGGRGFQMYRVRRTPSLQQHIVEFACQWWDKHIVRDTPPPLERLPDLKVLKSVRRVPNKTIELSDLTLVENWLAATEDARAAKSRADAAKAALEAALGDAEAAALPDGRLVTFYWFCRHIRAQAAREEKYRVLKITKGKRND